MNHNAQLSVQQQTAGYYHIGSRSLIILFFILPVWPLPEIAKGVPGGCLTINTTCDTSISLVWGAGVLMSRMVEVV